MAVDLASIFNPAGYDMAAPALKAFAQMAELGLQRQKLQQDAEFRLLDLENKRQEFEAEKPYREALALARKNQAIASAEAAGDAKIAAEEALQYKEAVASLFDEASGGSLSNRLDSANAEIRNTAAKQQKILRDRFGLTKNRQVIRELEQLEQTLGVRERKATEEAKIAAAAEKALKAEEARNRSLDQSGERLGLAKDKFEHQKQREKAQAEWRQSQAELANLQKNRALRAAELAAARKSFLGSEQARIPALVEQIRVADESIAELLKKNPPEEAIVVPGVETGVGGSLDAASGASVLPPLPDINPNRESPVQIKARIKRAGGTLEDLRKALRDAGYPTN